MIITSDNTRNVFIQVVLPCAAYKRCSIPGGKYKLKMNLCVGVSHMLYQLDFQDNPNIPRIVPMLRPFTQRSCTITDVQPVLHYIQDFFSGFGIYLRFTTASGFSAFLKSSVFTSRVLYCCRYRLYFASAGYFTSLR